MTRRGWLAAAAAVVLSGLVYTNAIHNPFVYDDNRVILQNRSIVPPVNLRAILMHDASRPVVNASYTLDRALYGPAPEGFHVTSILLHMIVVGLLFWVAWRVMEDWRRSLGAEAAIAAHPQLVAFAAAALFGVHPMLTEAVGYVSGRSEILCAVFFLAAFLCARRWLLGGSWRWRAVAIALWFVALASKETAAMFPFVVLIYDRVVRQNNGSEWRRAWRGLHLPLFVIATVLVAARLYLFVFGEHGGGLTFLPPFLLVEVDVTLRYLALMLLPNGQSVFHAIPLFGLMTLRAWLSLISLGALVAFTWWIRRRRGVASFGFAWFLLMFLPPAMLVAMDRGEPMAEHRVYLAACGLMLAAGATIGRMAARFGSVHPLATLILRVALVMAIVSFGARTVIRNIVWSQPVALWAEAVGKSPAHWYPRLLLGESLHNDGQHADAVAQFRIAMQLRPNEPALYTKVGTCLTELGRLDEAANAFARLQTLVPGSVEASNGLAAVALIGGRPDEARRRYRASLDLDPDNIQARRGLVVLEETIGNNPAEALRLCEEIARIAPGTSGNDDCINRNRARLGGGSAAR